MLQAWGWECRVNKTMECRARNKKPYLISQGEVLIALYMWVERLGHPPKTLRKWPVTCELYPAVIAYCTSGCHDAPLTGNC